MLSQMAKPGAEEQLGNDLPHSGGVPEASQPAPATDTTSGAPRPEIDSGGAYDVAAAEPDVDDLARPHGEADAEKKARPKPQPVRSLVELFTIKGATAGRLLRELEKGTSWKFADEDVETALALLPSGDPNLARTRQLLHDGIETREGRFARAAGDFALQVIAPDLEGLSAWPQVEGAEPVVALREFATSITVGLRDPKRQRRAHNALMIAVDFLSHRRGLSFEDAAPVLRETVGRPPEYERDRSNPRRHRIASVTLPRNDLESVRDLLDLLQPWEQELDEARRLERATSSRIEVAERAADEATRDRKRLEDEVALLRAELETARQEVEASRDRVQDVRIHASADVTELRTHSVAFLNTRLRDLLATAKEACEVQPARTPTAIRLLEQAIQELQKEVAWLRSSA
jgi:hypothetical protein